MPLVGFGLWKVNNDTCADTVYNAIKTGYRLFDGACGMSISSPPAQHAHSASIDADHQTTATSRKPVKVSPAPSRTALSSVKNSSLSPNSGTHSTTRSVSSPSARSSSRTTESTTLTSTLFTSPLRSNTSTPACATLLPGPTRTTSSALQRLLST